MRTRLMVAVVLVLALAVTASMVVAQRGPGKGGPGMGMCGVGGACMGCPLMGGFAPKMVQELGLTPDQVASMKQLHADFATATQADKDALKTKMAQMMALWNVDEPDATEIKALAADIDRDKAAMRDTGIDHMVRGLALLNKDQRAKVRDMVKDCAAKCMGGGCGMMMGPGKGMGAGAGKGTAPGCCPRGGGQGPTGTGCPMTK